MTRDDLGPLLVALAGMLQIMLTFTPSISPDVAFHEADIWERHPVGVVCAPGQVPPCVGTSSPEPQSWAVVPAGGGRLALWAPALSPGAVQMFRLRAVDAAGNRSVDAVELRP